MNETPTAEQLAAMTPVEVDTQLYRIWNEEAQADHRRLALQTALHKAVGDEGRRAKVSGRLVFALSWEQVLEKAVQKALAPHTEFEATIARDVHQALTNWAMAARELEALAAEARVYTDEFRRRGTWNRVFLAKSVGGHAHNGQECSTCHNGEFRTEFAWLVRYSGQTEAEIVADAGWRACTTCYPSAPVGDENTLPTRMFTPDEETAAKAREEREAAKVQRDATKASKGITAPDGSPLRSGSTRIETERAAVLEATSHLTEHYKNRRIEQIIAADPALAPFYQDAEQRARIEDRYREKALTLVEAIAHKRGVPAADVLAELEPKAYAKIKRDMGGKAAEVIAGFRYSASFRPELYDAYLAQCEKDGRKPWAAVVMPWYRL
ncbi:hypothetical protein ACH4S8_37160 [Streptomyces sp. NPDC021080]|uniref:hypothetical protein n=1 Tax=Streptomyces sp. NPDC021080 TaxID=3365110 RepID=UPI0037AEE395